MPNSLYPSILAASANSPGTVDSSYTGEICIIAENTHSAVEMHIAKGERVAQIVLQKVPVIEWNVVHSRDMLGNSERGAAGLGSTGNQ